MAEIITFQMDPIELEELRKDKAYLKVVKKYQKEEEELKKKHQKQRDSVQKQQVSLFFITTHSSPLLTFFLFPMG